SADGLGVQAVVDGRIVLVGRPQWLTDHAAIAFPPELANALAACENQGQTSVAVAWDGVARGILAVADTVKDTSAAAITEFRRLGLTPVRS
ncbi:HAD family hydrolase, partial [Glaciimonas sp. Cout2]|nr:HAD family hydrolase [Glaciimonas sp. Cout2]